MLRVTGEVVEETSHWGGTKCFRTRRAFRFKLRLYGKAAICGMTTGIFVGSDTLLPSGKRFYFHQSGNHKACDFFKHTGGIFCEWKWNKIIQETHEALQSQTRAHPHTQGEYEEMRAFCLQSRNQTGYGPGLGRRFRKFKRCKQKKRSPEWENVSPSLHSILTPFPLVHSCHRPSA